MDSNISLKEEFYIFILISNDIVIDDKSLILEICLFLNKTTMKTRTSSFYCFLISIKLDGILYSLINNSLTCFVTFPWIWTHFSCVGVIWIEALNHHNKHYIEYLEAAFLAINFIKEFESISYVERLKTWVTIFLIP